MTAGTAEGVPGALLAQRVVPVVVLDDPGLAYPLAAALAAGGLPVAEITLRTAGATDVIRALAAEPELLVGAGTVLDASQVDAVVAAGARFVVSPGLARSVVERCLEHGVLVIPGVATATEVMAALELGLTLLKFFPAEAIGGRAALAALAAPFREVRFVPTGGVGPDNAAAYLALPQVAAVGASWPVAPELLAAGDWDEVTRRTATLVALATGDAA